jgi:sulfatase modifying factor 1
LRSFLAIGLTFLLAVGCVSNRPASNTGLSKNPASVKFSKQKSKRKHSKNFLTSTKRHRQKFPPRSTAQKMLLPTITHLKDGSLMVLVSASVQRVSKPILPRGVIRPVSQGTPTSRSKFFSTFYMDRLETTVFQYKFFDNNYDEKPFTDGKECPDCPAMGIDWMSAHRYCHWAGKRLPTETEWVASAGGGQSNHWPWGEKFSPENANLWGEKDGSLAVAKVGSYPQGASPYGMMDAIGNVWEWVSDSYFAPGKESKKLRLRVAKGGGWTSAKRQARISFRNIVDPGIKNPTIGFRCAKSISRKK